MPCETARANALPVSDAIEVILSVDRKPLGPDAPQKWNATYLGKPLVTRVRVPSCESCRALLAMGITGRVNFRHEGSPHIAFWMDIEKGAGLTVEENDRGIRIAKYREFPTTVLSPAGILAPSHTDIPETENRAPAQTLED